MKTKIWIAAAISVAVIAAIGAASFRSGETEPPAPSVAAAPSAAKPGAGVTEIPVKGMVTMVDLGATECIPCKLMAPILVELEKEYDGRAAIVFIDVWKQPDQAKKYGIRAIPTQIFYDRDGREAFRHTGFMDKKTIVERLRQLGVG